MALQHFLLLRAAVGVAAVILFFICQSVTAQTLHNSDLHNVRNWQIDAAPSLAAFASYKDMNDYIANRHLRGLRKLDNPSDDSYIQAFNQYNEQSTQNSDSLRQKRNEERMLPNQPKLLMFEISDAVEPSDAVKALIKRHRSRELSDASKTVSLTDATSTKSTSASGDSMFKMIKVNKPKVRTKRMAPQQRMPANFKVQMIPFDVSDAKESDAEHKEIVKRMRSLELEKVTRTKRTTTKLPALTAKAAMNNWKSTNVPKIRSSRSEQLKMKITHKRARRSAPQMIKFELEDAKEPDASMKILLQQKQSASRESKAMKLESPLKSVQHNITDMMDSDSENSDQSSHESKRYFVYKESPIKTKKSVNSLPYEVQKVVTHLMKDNQGAKAYVKYLPAQKNDYNHFRSYPYSGVKYVQPSFGTKLQPTASFVKYYLPAQQKEQLQVQIHPVPVVEKVRYVYTPVAVDDGAHQTHAQAAFVTQQHYVAVAPAAHEHHTAAISQPIVVQDAGHAANAEHQATQIHHTYTADLSNVHQEEAGAHEVAAHYAHELAQNEISQAPVHYVASKEFHPSKPDPILEENKIADTGIADHHAAVHDYTGGEHHKYAVYPKAAHAYNSAYGKAHLQLLDHQQHAAEVAASAAPLIKIEYHAPPDPVKENYKELSEFKQLSHLMGKSPEDQIHGLTYLLAKEMQSKLQLQRQQKKLEEEALLSQHQRPQDSTSPILFHPTSKDGVAVKAVENIAEHSQFGAQPGHLIGMAKTKQYIPIVESKGLGGHVATNEESLAPQFSAGVKHVVAKLQPEKVPAPTSFVTYGLSPSYEQGAKAYQYARPQTHYATLSHHAAAPSGGGHQGLHTAVQHPIATAEEHQNIETNGVEKQPHANIGGIKLDQSLHIGSQLDDEHSLQYASKYAFGYRIRDFHTGNDFGHKQNRDLDGVTRGQYHILLPDGRIQNVIYHADDTGFHADVSFETGH